MKVSPSLILSVSWVILVSDMKYLGQGWRKHCHWKLSGNKYIEIKMFMALTVKHHFNIKTGLKTYIALYTLLMARNIIKYYQICHKSPMLGQLIHYHLKSV